MARTPRDNTPGRILHVISRFVDREWFFEGDHERAHYLRLLSRGLRSTDWLLLAYALMSSHIHLQFLVGHLPMEVLTRRVNSPFARWMNERHGRLGPVFAERANDFEFEVGNSGQLTAYIHNNPVRAGVVSHARESTWTSHRAYAGLEEAPPWLHVEEGLRLAGFQDRGVFDDWVNITPGERVDSVLDQERRVVRRRGAVELATPRVGAHGVAMPVVKRAFGHVRPDPRRVVTVVTDVLGIDENLLCSRRRDPSLVDGRGVAVRSGRAMGLTLSELAAALGLSVQGVLHTSRRGLSLSGERAMAIVVERLRAEMGALTVAM